MFFIFSGSNLTPIRPMFAVFADTWQSYIMQKISFKRNVIKKLRLKKNSKLLPGWVYKIFNGNSPSL